MGAKQKLDINELWRTWNEENSENSYQQLVDRYIGLVDQVVKRMLQGMSNQVTYDELKSSGMIGFIDALNKFDYKRGLQFETYATLRIRGSILDGLRENDWIPRSIRDKSKKFEKAYHYLEQLHLRSVTDCEVMNYLEMDEKEFYQSLQETSFMNYLSLDESIDDEQEITRTSFLADNRNAIDDIINRDHDREILANAINRLPIKEKNVVALYYYEELNLTEISEIMGLSTSRISQLHTKAIYRLRGSLGRQKKNFL
ncbi:MAG: FliA/WhiG family RNA polymerase sigma factor [Vulcanibacillus sp.]